MHAPEDSFTGRLPQAEAVDVTQSAVVAAAEAPAVPSTAGLKRAIAGGAVWTVIGFGAMQVLRFASNVLLSRLLNPSIFGLMNLVNVFNQGLQMFTDVGVGPSLIQGKRGDEPAFRDTAWTIMVARGFFLWGCSLLIAWPIALLYDREGTGLPSLGWLVPAVGASAAISGFDSTALYTLRRRLLRARLVLLEVGTYALTMTLTVLWVWYVPTVWALVCSNLFSCAVQMVLSHFLIPGYRNGWAWDRAAVHELIHFGKWVFLSTICTFLANQADRLIVGFQGYALLGVYGIAAMIAAIPIQLMVTLSWQLVFPLYSRLEQSGIDSRAVVPRIHPVAAGFGAVLVAGLIAAGPTVIRGVYDFRYEQAGWMVALLAVGAWFQMLEVLQSSVLWALGQTRRPALSNAAKVVALAVLAPLGGWLAGFPGMLLGFVTSDLIRYALTQWALRREGVYVLRHDLALTLFLAVTAAAGAVAGDFLWPHPVRPAFVATFGVDPAAGLPGALPWGGLALGFRKDWLYLLARAGTEGTVVVLPWLALAVLGWRLGVFRRVLAARSLQGEPLSRPGEQAV